MAVATLLAMNILTVFASILAQYHLGSLIRPKVVRLSLGLWSVGAAFEVVVAMYTTADTLR